MFNTMDDVYKDIDNYNTKRDKKVLIVFDDMLQMLQKIKDFKA